MKIAYRLLFVLLISMFLFGCGEKTASIQGKIVDGKGNPVSGVSMIFKQVQPTQGYEQFETKTGADGSFLLKGVAPSSDYTITMLSEKWKTNVTQKIKTLEAGQVLTLAAPIKIRFNQMKDGTIIDTKTGMQWFIYPVSDITAENVVDTVKGLNQGGFADWRLPSRADLASLQEEKASDKVPSAEPVLVNKVCCAWVLEPNTEVDWKFYVEEENELWASNKDTPDNRIVVVRDSTGAAPAAAVAAQAPVVVPPVAEQAPAVTAETPAVKTVAGVRQASRKACAAKKAQAAKSAPLTETAAKTSAAAAASSAATKDTAKVVTLPPVKIQEPAKAEPPAKISDASLSESLYFDMGSRTLKAPEAAKLKAFLSKIKGQKGSLIIDGYSDATGANDTANLLISMQRASNVAAAAHKAGMGKNIKVELRAAGVNRPVASNDTEDGRQKNRRVDVSFMPE